MFFNRRICGIFDGRESDTRLRAVKRRRGEEFHGLFGDGSRHIDGGQMEGHHLRTPKGIQRDRLLRRHRRAHNHRRHLLQVQ